jgi:nitroreductase
MSKSYWPIILLGIIAMAIGLASVLILGSEPTLTCTHTRSTQIECNKQMNLLGMLPIGKRPISNVQRAWLIDKDCHPGGCTYRIELDTTDGSVPLTITSASGPRDPDAAEQINTFIQSPHEDSLVIKGKVNRFVVWLSGFVVVGGLVFTALSLGTLRRAAREGPRMRQHMNTLEAIVQRRSIRKFKDTPISEAALETILTAATQAPSGKNRQPWRFIVVKEDRRAEMVCIMREAVECVKAEGGDVGSSAWTADVMERAPVTIFVFSEAENSQDRDWKSSVVDVQSIGAAIQNMLLAAQELGIGSLWICDVFCAYAGLRAWLGETHEMIAAVSLGYPDESPDPRPRKSMNEVTRWL